MKLMNKRRYINPLLFIAMLVLLALSMPFSSISVRAEGTDTEEGPDPNFHIYIAFGQSNMEGMGKIEKQDLECDDNYLVMCTSDNYDDNGNKRELGKWYKATPPLAHSQGAQLGVADYFGREMLKVEQDNDPDVRIGIIVVAVRGASIQLFDKELSPAYMNPQAEWFKNIVNDYGGNPYQRMIDCAKLAQKDGVIKGIIMHQGESDADDSDWPSKVKALYDNIVKDLNLDKNTPLLAGEVLRGGSYQGANNNIADLPLQSPNFYVVSSEGLTAGDMMKIHFTAEGYRDFGKRYAEKMLEVENFKKKQRYNITVSDDGNGTANSSYNWGTTGKEIYLTATPDEGYKFKEWQVISGGVTIVNDKFTVGTEDISIKAVFEKIPEPTPTATPTPTPTPTPEPTPTAEPEATPVPTPTASPTAAPVEYKDGDEYKDEASNVSYKITSTEKLTIALTGLIDKNATEIVVPDDVTIGDKSYKITEIAPNAFKNNKKLKKFTIGKNIEKIGKNAFYGCKNLKTIKIKTSKLTKKTVGKNAFKKIHKKAKITVPKKKLKAYKKLLKAKGVTGKKQKIKK